MSTILNLTQHKSTLSQKSHGVFEPANKQMIQEVLTFTNMPTKEAIARRAGALARIVEKLEGFKGEVMIGGAPYLMGPLEKALKKAGCQPVYAFSLRDTVEEEVDGKVIKRQVFNHLGFVKV